MVVEKEELGLSLSLSFQEKSSVVNPTFNLIMPPNSSSPSLPFNVINNNNTNTTSCWTQPAFPSSGDRTSNGTLIMMKGIDVNCLPEEEEGGGVSSPNSTISSISGSKRDQTDDGGSDEEDGDNSRKKLRLSKDQSAILEETFKEHNTLNPKQKMSLAKRLGLRPRQVEVWFQNRRARTKLKQTEVDCEYLKRCCENLTEENRRLQKEVQQLRALKLSPKFYMQMNPPTTLTMCPSCERVAVPVPHQSSQRPITTSFNPWPTPASIPHRSSFDSLLKS